MKKNEIPTNTPDWLRSFKGCEHLTDDEAFQVIDSLKELAAFLVKSRPAENGTLIDNQLIISSKNLQTDNKVNRAA